MKRSGDLLLIFIGIALRFFIAIAAPASLALAQINPTVRIVSPEDGTVVNPGQTVVIVVEVSGGKLDEVGAISKLAPSLPPLKSPPYQFAIRVPDDADTGPEIVGAMGHATGKDAIFSVPIHLDVEMPAPPESVTTDSASMELAVGEQIGIYLQGKFRDGRLRNLTHSSRNTFVSQSPDIARVTSDGLVFATSPGATQIFVNGSVPIQVTVLPFVRIFPVRTTIVASETREFTSATAGLANEKVTWSIEPAVGSIAPDGRYTAPVNVASEQIVRVIVTSQADSTKSASATVTLSPVAKIDISPGYAVLYGGQTQKFTATAANMGTSGLDWSISGAGSISQAGVYTAPASITGLQTVTVTAASVESPSTRGSVKFWISAPPFKVHLPRSPVTMSQDKPGSIAVTVIATDHYPRPIKLTLMGVPAGVSAAFAKNPISGNETTTLKLAPTGGAATGTYTVFVFAQDSFKPDIGAVLTFTLNILGPSPVR